MAARPPSNYLWTITCARKALHSTQTRIRLVVNRVFLITSTAAIAFATSACAAGITPLGNGQFRSSAKRITVSKNRVLKVAMHGANEHCAKTGQRAHVISKKAKRDWANPDAKRASVIFSCE